MNLSQSTLPRFCTWHPLHGPKAMLHVQACFDLLPHVWLSKRSSSPLCKGNSIVAFSFCSTIAHVKHQPFHFLAERRSAEKNGEVTLTKANEGRQAIVKSQGNILGCGSKPMVPFWGRCTTRLNYFCEDWDIHCRFDLAFDPWPL